ncbi:MAG: hypothetical protein GY859_19400 [Desulfobacterales bacterium]|nr:hypothetical protein [Desulfobacterales bacterium]
MEAFNHFKDGLKSPGVSRSRGLNGQGKAQNVDFGLSVGCFAAADFWQPVAKVYN